MLWLHVICMATVLVAAVLPLAARAALHGRWHAQAVKVRALGSLPLYVTILVWIIGLGIVVFVWGAPMGAEYWFGLGLFSAFLLVDVLHWFRSEPKNQTEETK